MIRLLVHADLFEIEALIASGGWNSSGRSYPLPWMEILETTIDAYETPQPDETFGTARLSTIGKKKNALQEIGYWPSTGYLRNRIMPEQPEFGIQADW